MNGSSPAPPLIERLDSLSPEKRALVERMLAGRGDVDQGPPPITRRRESGPCRLSYAQELMWLVHELTPGTNVYNVSGARRLRGHLDVDVLQRALDEVAARHDSFRTNFAELDGVPVQFVNPHARVPLRVKDLRDVPAEERPAEVDRIVNHEIRHRFDLRAEQLLRAALIRVAEDEHVLVTVANHIVWDGWSKGVFFRELAALYDAFLNGRPSPLPEPGLQYTDYAAWQREWLQGPVLDELVGYWRDRLAGAPKLLSLPTDRPRPAVQTFRGSRQSLYLPGTVLRELEELSRRRGATLFMTLAAAVKTLLHRYSGEDDIVIGTPIASRNRTELEQLIGYFTNTIVLRTDLSGNPTFDELLGRMRETALGALEHQDAPFERVVQAVRPERDLSHSPIFQVLFTLQNAAPETLHLTGLTMELLRTDSGTSKFDLSFGIGERWGQLHTSVEYSTDLFDADTITRLRANFGTLLQGIAAAPERRLSELPLLSDAERTQVLVEWNETVAERAGGEQETLHGLVEAQAVRTPHAEAVVDGERSLTYAELDARANRLARHLRSLGAGSESKVGLCMARSIESAVGTLGILKAGAACVPLDPAYPPERLAVMAADAELAVLLTQQGLGADVPAKDAEVVWLDVDWPAIEQEPADPLPPAATGDDVAYVIYTSGSTGGARGVLLPHRGLANHASAAVDLYDLGAGDRVLQFSSISFDISIEELFPTWAAGGTVVMRPPDVPIAGPGFVEYLEAAGITVLDLPTAFWHEWVGDLAALGASPPESLRLVIVGGEKALGTALAEWREIAGERIRWTNTYGPTEASVIATAWELPPDAPAPADPPIGRPIRGVRAYVLDEHGEPVPIGVRGELYLGGAGVALGYLGHPQLTAERFVPDPFGDGAALFRTGDLVRHRPDGTLEFVGRTDHQLKIRGFRVEPGEVAAALAEHPDVREAAAAAPEHPSGQPRLVGYVVPVVAPGPTPGELRRFLRGKLPGPAIPTAFVSLESLPVLPNGKLDRARLPVPQWVQVDERRFVEPRDDTERTIASIWQDVLALDEPVGARDGFFDLGGHSLLAVRLFAELERITGVRLPLAELFIDGTVEHLAELVRREQAAGAGEGWSTLVELQRGAAHRPPLFLCPWANGELLAYRHLVRHLDPEQPVFGLQAQGLDGRRPPHRTIEEMAAHYAAEIRSAFPEGPYLLGGYCFGGTVAFQVARFLEDAGEQVELVALLDAKPFGYTNVMSRPEKERAYFREFVRSDLRGKLDWVRMRARHAHKKSADRVWYAMLGAWLLIGRPLPAALQDVPRVNASARKRFVTPTARCPAVLFRPGPVGDRVSYWTQLAQGGLEEVGIDLPGIDHENMVQEPFVSTLGAELDARLARLAASRQGATL